MMTQLIYGMKLSVLAAAAFDAPISTRLGNNKNKDLAQIQYYFDKGELLFVCRKGCTFN
jgi:hypothetical protein